MFPPQTKILIADDTKTIRTMLKDMLIKIGFATIKEAEDGSQAMQIIMTAADEGSPVDMIICDWNMRGMTGLDLLEIRNSDPRYRMTPFLMVTIERERDYVLRAVAMGVSDYVVKPFSENTVRTKLQSIWNRLHR